MEEVVDYKDQTEEFFMNVKKSNGNRMNPRLDLALEHVCEANLEEVFEKVAKFRTTNNKLHLETKKKLFSLYAKIYRTPHVTNNDFMSWVVKGYIEGMKGHNINWAKVIAYTTREKAWKESTKNMQKTSIKLELSKLSGGEV
jgi:hypothetical protein